MRRAGEEPERNPSVLLRRWIREESSPLVILLDEAAAFEPEGGRAFFEAVQLALGEELPFALVVAGTPDAPRALRRAGTFTERALSRVPIGRLARPAAIRALAEPAESAGRPFDPEAADSLASEAQDYPYFVQLLGRAAWKQAESTGDSGVGMAAARRGIETVRRDIQCFYGERYAEARERSVHRTLVPLAKLMKAHGGKLDDAALDGFLAAEAPPDGEARLLQTLTDLGVLWEAETAIWEMGIPSFADHVLERSGAPGR